MAALIRIYAHETQQNLHTSFLILIISPVSSLTIHFLDVGQGDSALIEHNGHTMLIDVVDEMNAKIDPETALRIIALLNDYAKDHMILSITHYGTQLKNSKELTLTLSEKINSKDFLSYNI